MQRFLKFTFLYQPMNYFEVKLWIMTKNKTKVILMEPINTLETIISTIGGFLLQIFKWQDLWLCPYLFLFASESLKLIYTKTFKTFKNYTNSFLLSLANKLHIYIYIYIYIICIQWFHYVAIPKSYINTM